MSEEQKKRRGRGRPAKSPEKRPRLHSDSQSSSINHEIEIRHERPKGISKGIDLYNELYQNLTNEGISQQGQHLLRKIVAESPYSGNGRTDNLLKNLNVITQELLMNELEIVILSIYLEKFGWVDRTLQIDHLLRFVGYAVKHNYSEDINAINSYIDYKYPGFRTNFESWQEKNRSFMAVNPRDLNDKFKELSKAASLPGDAKIMDYNSYVDDILQYNPHMLYDKPNLDEIMGDPACIELIHAIKSKKKILNRESEEVALSVLLKIENAINDISIPYKEDTQPNEKIYLANPAALQKLEAFSENNLEDVEREDDD